MPLVSRSEVRHQILNRDTRSKETAREANTTALEKFAGRMAECAETGVTCQEPSAKSSSRRQALLLFRADKLCYSMCADHVRAQFALSRPVTNE